MLARSLLVHVPGPTYNPSVKIVNSLLVVDDNPGDIELCKIVFGGSGRFPNIYSVRDGQEAIDLFLNYERSRLEHPGAFPPTLVLLDINMPRMNGFEFLEEYRKLRSLQDEGDIAPSIVVMVTSSTDPRDRAKAEALGVVADFIHKPPTAADAEALAERYGTDA